MHHIALLMASLLLFPARRPGSTMFLAILLTLTTWTVIFASSSWDYAGYLRYFECATSTRCDIVLQNQVEASFTLIAVSVASIFGDAGGPIVIALYSVTAVVIKLNVFRKQCTYFGVAVFAYLCFDFFQHDMTQIRAGLAIAFLYLAYIDLTQPRRRWRTLLWFLLAIFMHNSAAVAIVVPAMRIVRLTPTRAAGLLIAAAVIGRLLNVLTETLLKSIPGDLGGRLLVYATIGQNGVLTVAQLPVFAVLVAGLVLLLLAADRHSRLSDFELTCLHSVLCGLLLYLLTYWIPVISIRAFELLASPLPIIAAATYRICNQPSIRTATALAMFALFANVMLRNGLMLDLVLDGQAQQSRILEQ